MTGTEKTSLHYARGFKPERLGGSFVSSAQLGYLKECRAGERLRLSAGTDNGTWYVQGDGPEGRPRFDAALTLSPLDNP